MKTLIVLTLDLGAPEDAATALAAIDPPSIPGFAGDARIAVEPVVGHVLDYLDGEDATPDPLAGIAPRILPLGQTVTRDDVRAVWDTYVVPTQSDDAPPQSLENRALASILRAVYVALPATDKEPAP